MPGRALLTPSVICTWTDFVRDGWIDIFVTDDPAALSESKDSTVLPKSELESFLGSHAQLVASQNTNAFGDVRVYKIDWESMGKSLVRLRGATTIGELRSTDEQPVDDPDSGSRDLHAHSCGVSVCLGAAGKLPTVTASGADEANSLDGASLGIPGIFTGRFGYRARPDTTPLSAPVADYPAHQPDRQFSARASAFHDRGGPDHAGCVRARQGVIWPRGRTVAALLVALSATMLNYSQDLRPYSMLAFLTTLSVYCLVKAKASESGWWWAAFGLSSILNLLNTYMALTIAMPAFAPYLAGALYQVWSRRKENRRSRHTRSWLSLRWLLGLLWFFLIHCRHLDLRRASATTRH